MPHQCTSCGRTFADGSKEMLSGCPDCGGNKFQFKPAASGDGRNAGSGPGGGGAGGGATAAKKQPADAPSADAPETRGDRAPDDGNARSTDHRSAVNRAAATVREWVGSRDDADDAPAGSDGRAGSPDGSAERPNGPAERPDTPTERPDRPTERPSRSPEDSAQASARSDVVSESELPDAPRSTDAPASTDTATSTESPTSTDDGVPGDSRASGTVEDESNVVDAPDDDNPGLEELREELNSQFESIRIVNPGQYELNLMELYEREEYIISLQEDGKYVIEVPDAWDAVER